MMIKDSNYQRVFDELKSILVGFADDLMCEENAADHYYLNTKHVMKNKKPMFFGAVRVRKNYVSYHLMPVYVFPE